MATRQSGPRLRDMGVANAMELGRAQTSPRTEAAGLQTRSLHSNEGDEEQGAERVKIGSNPSIRANRNFVARQRLRRDPYFCKGRD